MIRGVKTPPKSRIHPLALIENKESIQVAIMEVINALIRNTIDPKRAQLILRALHIAVKNSRASFITPSSEVIREVPNYPPAPAQEKRSPPPAPAPKPENVHVAAIETVEIAMENLAAQAAARDAANRKPPAKSSVAKSKTDSARRDFASSPAG
jgi:type IV secretory pathway VirB10-like protein